MGSRRSGPVASLLVAGPLLLAACHDPAATGIFQQSVRDGTPAPDEPAAVALSLRGGPCDDVPGAPICSGALVQSRLVLTAGHCAERYAPDRIEVWTGASLESPDIARRRVAAISVHPKYTDTSSDFDVALLTLDSPLEVPPWPVLSTPMDATWVGRTVRVLGFGETGDSAETGERRAGTAVIDEVADATFTLAPGPALTCRGDSGGPVLADIDGVPHLVGVTSAGDPDCTDQSVAVRINSVYSGFVEVALAAPPTGAKTAEEETCEPAPDEEDSPPSCAVTSTGAPGARLLLAALGAALTLLVARRPLLRRRSPEAPSRRRPPPSRRGARRSSRGRNTPPRRARRSPP